MRLIGDVKKMLGENPTSFPLLPIDFPPLEWNVYEILTCIFTYTVLSSPEENFGSASLNLICNISFIQIYPLRIHGVSYSYEIFHQKRNYSNIFFCLLNTIKANAVDYIHHLETVFLIVL